MSPLPVVLVLAAGRGERFKASGGSVHKLQAVLAGKRVLDHVLDAVRGSGLPHHVVKPDATRPGMGDSIAAGVQATLGAPGWLVLPGDLPLIRSETLRTIAMARSADVTVPRYLGRRGHPVHFAAACAQELLDLKGNQGAALVMRGRAAMDSVAYVDVDDIGTVTDVDTLEDLYMAEKLLAQR
jgi:molybdenum cofactor cytidylyltransferase